MFNTNTNTYTNTNTNVNDATNELEGRRPATTMQGRASIGQGMIKERPIPTCDIQTNTNTKNTNTQIHNTNKVLGTAQ